MEKKKATQFEVVELVDGKDKWFEIRTSNNAAMQPIEKIISSDKKTLTKLLELLVDKKITVYVAS